MSVNRILFIFLPASFPFLFFVLGLSFAIYMNWIYGIKQNIPIPRSSFTRKIYVRTDFIFKSFNNTYAKHRKEITWSLLRFWTFFIGGWIRFGVTVRVCHNKMAVWVKQPRWGDSAARILRMLIRPPANFRQSFASRFSKVEIFSGTAKFSSLYAGTSRVPPRVLAVWAKTLRGQLLLLFPLFRKIFILGIIYSFPQQVTFKKI